MTEQPTAFSGLEGLGDNQETDKEQEGEYLIKPSDFSKITEQVRSELEEKINSESMQKIAGLKRKSEELWSEVARGIETDDDSKRKLYEEAYSIDKKLNNLPDYGQFLRLRDDFEAISKQRPETRIRGETAQEMLEYLIKTGSKGHETDSAHIFVDERDIDRLYDADLDPRLYLYTDGQSVDIPIGLIVSGDSFESWHGRPKHISKDGRPSDEVIEEYANKPEETAPPVEYMTAYLLPDGRVFFRTGNSHRVGAAIRRGDEAGHTKTVKFDGRMNLVLLPSVPRQL